MGEKHNLTPDKKIYIQRVGVRNLRTVMHICRDKETFTHIPSIDVFIDVSENQKGIHMSRLQSAINKVLSGKDLVDIGLEEVGKKILESIDHPFECGEVKINSTIGIKTKTPKSNNIFTEVHDIAVTVIKNKKYSKILEVNVTGNSCCPCTGHQQRAKIDIQFKTELDSPLLIEQLINCAEKSFSSEVYSIVRTSDEEHIVEKMRSNPKFVEDLVRDCEENIRDLGLPGEVKITAIANDSIHRHDVFAENTFIISNENIP